MKICSVTQLLFKISNLACCSITLIFFNFLREMNHQPNILYANEKKKIVKIIIQLNKIISKYVRTILILSSIAEVVFEMKSSSSSFVGFMLVTIFNNNIVLFLELVFSDFLFVNVEFESE